MIQAVGTNYLTHTHTHTHTSSCIEIQNRSINQSRNQEWILPSNGLRSC